MKKRLLCAVMILMLFIASIATLTACGEKEKTIYDAGEYGTYEYRYGQHVVHANPGYRFIDWSEPVQQGNKTIYKAQYKHAEYYMPEVKDAYEIPRGTDFPPIMRKVTDMQTMESTEDLAPVAYIDISCTDERFNWGKSGEYIVVGIDINTKEFDGICTVYINDLVYHIEQEFELHVFRNRIKAESIEIFVYEYTIGIDDSRYIYHQVEPQNTSFPRCGYNILEIIRDGKAIDEDKIAEIAYVDEWDDLCTTDKAQVGDIIKLQAYNLRDPDVVSNVIWVTVY